jgi:hypothetical protein
MERRRSPPGVLAGSGLMVSNLTLYSEDGGEEEAIPDMKALT